MPPAEASGPERATAAGGRILALEVPLFPLAALIRSEPGLAERPVVVLDGGGTAARVAAATRPARRAGIRPGLTLAQARALLPACLVRSRDPAAEASAREALAEAAGTVSPRVELSEGGLALADLTGTERLFPSEETLAQEAILAAGRLGLPARAGVAGSRLVAAIAAGRPPSPRVVPPGGEERFLAPLPVAALGPSPRLARILEAWGVRQVGDLARLPRAEVAARLGAEGTALHRAARGIDPRPLVPTPPPAVLREALTLEWPAARLEPFLYAVESCLSRLARRLETRGSGCRRLDLELDLEPEGSQRRSLRLPAPTTDPRILLDLVGLELEHRPPGAPVTACRLLAHPVPRRPAQLSLFGPEEPSPEETGHAVARITARLGAACAGSPRAVDCHLPEAREVAVFEPPPPPRFAPQARPAPGLLAVRVLDPPRPVEVILDEATGRPVSLRTPPGTRPHLQGLVRAAAGPWPLDTGWWEEDGPEAGEPASDGASSPRRSYMDVELARGEVLRLFATPAGEWYVDGIYD